jgi:hypothetical protein
MLQSNNMKCWEIWLYANLIDKVFFRKDMTADEVKQSLVNHDGYNPFIGVHSHEYDVRKAC